MIDGFYLQRYRTYAKKLIKVLRLDNPDRIPKSLLLANLSLLYQDIGVRYFTERGRRVVDGQHEQSRIVLPPETGAIT